MYGQMKRRGFKPTTGTFATLMAGYVGIEDWRMYTMQLENVHTIMRSFAEHAKVSKQDPALAFELDVKPINMYITILGDAREYQKMFDVFNEMDKSGWLAPTSRTYSNLFSALAERIHVPGSSREALGAQSASDAKLFWRQALNAAAGGKLHIDDRMVGGLIRCLGRGRPSDVLFGLDVVHEYCGLSRPGETPLPPKVAVEPPVISSIFDMCLHGKKHRLIVHFAQQLMDTAQAANLPCPMDVGNVESVLRAYACLAALGSMGEADQALELLRWMQQQAILYPERAQAIRPRREAYYLVLMSCWRGADWASAVRTMEMLTGCDGSHFRDGYKGVPSVVRRSRGAATEPDVKVLATLLRCAQESKDIAHMRQCLRISDFFHVEMLLKETYELLAEQPTVLSEQSSQEPEDGRASMKVGKRIQDRQHQRFYGSKLASALAEVVSEVLPFTIRPRPANASDSTSAASTINTSRSKRDYAPTEQERTRWLELKSKAMVINRIVKNMRSTLPVPMAEEQPLGTLRSLTSIDKSVEDVWTKRQQNSA